MKIFRIFSSAVERRASRKAVETIEQREARIAENFSMKLNLNKDESEAYRQIYPMREAIANYAKARNVKIEVSEPSSQSSQNIAIKITNPNNSINYQATVRMSADTHRTYPETILIANPKANNGVLHAEDNFLRHFFRKIEDMVNKLQQS